MDEREELISEVINQTIGKDQDKFISILREKHHFRFIENKFAEALAFRFGEYNVNPLGVKKIHYKGYYWMLRTIKLSSKPKRDKYDPNLAIGIRFIGKRRPVIAIYLNGKFYKSIRRELKIKPRISVKNRSSIKYIDEMTYDERAKFRGELRKMKNNRPYNHEFMDYWYPLMLEFNRGCDELVLKKD